MSDVDDFVYVYASHGNSQEIYRYNATSRDAHHADILRGQPVELRMLVKERGAVRYLTKE